MSTHNLPLLSENKGGKPFPLLNSGEKSASFEEIALFVHFLHSLLHSYYILKKLLMITLFSGIFSRERVYPSDKKFKILQESCMKSCMGMHSSTIFLARFLQDLNPLITRVILKKLDS